MNKTISAQQAKTVSITDMAIYNEIDYISRAIYAAALAGNLEATIDDGTAMTESTPVITVTSSGAGAFTENETIVIAGTTITLGSELTDGTGIDQAIADINNAEISGLTAARTGNEIQLVYQPSQSSWILVLAEGSGTALADLGFTAGTITATVPGSVAYYNVWSGASEDRKKSYEYSQVVSYFQDLGYNIIAKKNTITENTFYWEVYF